MDNNIKLIINTELDTAGAEQGMLRFASIIGQLVQITNNIVTQTSTKVKTLGEIGKAAKTAAVGQQALAKATTAAGNAAKSSLASFDQLNILQAKTTSGGGGGSKPSKPAGDNKPEDIEWLAKALELLLAATLPLRTALDWLWNSFLEPLASWTGELAQIGLDNIVGLLARMSAWVDDNKDKLLGLWESIEPIFSLGETLIATVLDSIKAYFGLWCDSMTDGLIGFMDLFTGILTGDWEQAWSGVQQIFESGKELLLGGLSILWEGMSTGFANAWETIKEIFAPATEWFAENVFTPLSENFGWLWEGIVFGADLCWQTLKVAIFEPLGRFILDKLITPIFGAVKKLWDDIMDMTLAGVGLIKGAIGKFIADFMEMSALGANMIIWLINAIIKALNTIQVDIPEWVPKYGGNSFGVNIPLIPEVPVPKLATGAVIPANREFVAILGDQRNGRNLEAPEALIRQIVREESGGQDGAPLSVELLLDGDVIYRTMLEHEARQGYRVGGEFANAY